MFKNQTKKNIIKAFQNIDHLKRESKLKIDLFYLFFFIPVFLFIFNSVLIIPLFRGELFITDRLMITIFFIAVAINIYRISWTFQNSFRCFFTFVFLILGYFYICAYLANSPLTTTPVNAFLNSVINLIQGSPPSKFYLNQYAEMLINNNAVQQIFFDRYCLMLSIVYTHLIIVFASHYQIRRTQTMLYLHECKLEPEEIAEYIVDPEKNSFLLDEAFHRSNLKNRNIFKDRFKDKYQYSRSSSKAEDFMKPIVPKKNINDE